MRAAITPADGKVLVPGTDPIPENRLVFNLRAAVLPRVLIQAKTPQAVRESIAWAKQHAVPLCGHGVSSRKFGLTTDNLLSVRLVDASGTELRASPTENADLLWALQGGGGGNFGIATEFVFRVHPVGRVIIFRIRWPAATAAAALAKWQNWCLRP